MNSQVNLEVRSFCIILLTRAAHKGLNKSGKSMLGCTTSKADGYQKQSMTVFWLLFLIIVIVSGALSIKGRRCR
jgi:hypothetical protein